jgi:hypothetical protein
MKLNLFNRWLRLNLTKIAAALIVVVLFIQAREPRISASERSLLASRFHFVRYTLAVDASAPSKTVRAVRAGGQAIRVSENNVSGDTNLILRAPLATDPPILLFLADLMREIKVGRRNDNSAVSIPALDGMFPAQQVGDFEGAGRLSKPL